jgi:tape measure domain-containing protein
VASTLATLLIKLGFDVSDIAAGGRVARSELEAVGAAARKAGNMLLPTAAALTNLAKAADSVKGTAGGTVSLNNLAKAAQAVSAATGGSAPAMNSFARAAAAIGASTQSGSALNAFAKAAAAVTTATSSPQVLSSFAKAATQVAQAGTPAGVIAFAKAIESLAPAAATGEGGLRAIQAASKSVSDSFAGVETATKAAAGGIGSTLGAAGAATGALNALGGAAAGAIGGVSALGAAEIVTGGEASDLAGDLAGAIGAAATAGDAAADLAGSLAGAVGSLSGVGSAADVTGDAAADLAGDLANVGSAATGAGQASGTFTEALAGVAESLDIADAALDNLVAGLSTAGPESLNLAIAIDAIQAVVEETRVALDALTSLAGDYATNADAAGSASDTFGAGLRDVQTDAANLDSMLQEIIGHMQEARDLMQDQDLNEGLGPEGGQPAIPLGPGPLPPTAGGADLGPAIEEIERLLGLTRELQDDLGGLGSAFEDVSSAAEKTFSQADLEAALPAFGEAMAKWSDEISQALNGPEVTAIIDTLCERLSNLMSVAEERGLPILADEIQDLAAALENIKTTGPMAGEIEAMAKAVEYLDTLRIGGSLVDKSAIAALKVFSEELARVTTIAERAQVAFFRAMTAGLEMVDFQETMGAAATPLSFISDMGKLTELLSTWRSTRATADLEAFTGALRNLGTTSEAGKAEVAAMLAEIEAFSARSSLTLTAPLDILAEVGRVAAEAGTQGASAFDAMISTLDEISKSSSTMLTMGDAINALKASAQSWQTTGTGPISVEEMTRQIAVLTTYKQGLLSTGDAVHRLANEGAPAFDVLAAAQRTAADATAEAAAGMRELATLEGADAFLTNLVNRLDAVQEAAASLRGAEAINIQPGALEALESLRGMLADVAAFMGRNQEVTPFDVPMMRGAAAALDVVEASMSKNSLTVTDATIAYREFALAALAAKVELGQFGKVAGSEAQGVLTNIAADMTSRLLSFSGNTAAAQQGLTDMLNELVEIRLTAQSLDDVRLIAFTHGLSVLASRAQDGVVSVEDLRAAWNFYEETATRAEVITSSLGGGMQRAAVDGDLLSAAAERAARGMNELRTADTGAFSSDFLASMTQALFGLTPATGEAAESLNALQRSAAGYTAAALNSNGVISDQTGAISNLASTAQYLTEHLTDGKVTIDEIREAYDLFLSSAGEGSTAFTRMADGVRDLTYGEAVFEDLVARIENLVGTSAAANHSLDLLRDGLRTLGEAAGMGRTMDPTVIKAYIAAVEALESAQQMGMVSTKDLDAALAAQTATMQGAYGPAQGIAAALNAIHGASADTAAEAQVMLRIFDNLIASGRISGEVMNDLERQMTRTDINAWATGNLQPGTMPIDMLDETVGALSQLWDGAITASQAIEALESIQNRWAGSLEATTDDLGQMVDTLGDVAGQGIAALGSAAQDAQGYLEGLDGIIRELAIEPNDLIASGTPEQVREIREQIEWLRDALGPIARGEFVPSASALQGLEDQVSALTDLAMGDATVSETLEQLSRDFDGAAASAKQTGAGLDNILQISDKVASSLEYLTEKLFDMAGATKDETARQNLAAMSAEVAQMSAEIKSGEASYADYRAKIDAFTEAIRLLEIELFKGSLTMQSMGGALKVISEAAANADESVKSATASWEGGTERAQKLYQEVHKLAMALTDMPESKGATFGEPWHEVVGQIAKVKIALEGVATSAYAPRLDLSSVLQAIVVLDAFKNKTMSVAEAASELKTILGSSYTDLAGKPLSAAEEMAFLQRKMEQLSQSAAGPETAAQALERLTNAASRSAGEVGELITELQLLVSSGQMDADVAQPMLDGLRQMKQMLTSVDEEFVAWVQSEIASAKELGAGLSESQMDAAQTAQFLGSMLETLTDKTGPAKVALEALADVVANWAKTGEGSLSKMAELFDLLDQMGAVGPAMLPEGVGPKVISKADTEALQGFLNSLKEVDTAAIESAQALDAETTAAKDNASAMSDAAKAAIEMLNARRDAVLFGAAGGGGGVVPPTPPAPPTGPTPPEGPDYRRLAADLNVYLERMRALTPTAAAAGAAMDRLQQTLMGLYGRSVPARQGLQSLFLAMVSLQDALAALPSEQLVSAEQFSDLQALTKVIEILSQRSINGAVNLGDLRQALASQGAATATSAEKVEQGAAALTRYAAATQAATRAAAAYQAYGTPAGYVPSAMGAGAGAGAGVAGTVAAGAAAAGAAANIGNLGGAAANAGVALGVVGAAAGGAVPPINNAGNAAGNAAANLGRVPAQANRAAAAIKNVGIASLDAADRSSFLNRTLSMAFAFSGGVAVTNVIGFITQALVGFNSQLQQTRIAFTTLMGDEGAANAFIEKMQAFADITPFQFLGLKDSVQRLVAMGFAAEDTLYVLTAVGDAVAATGGGAEKLDRITVALGQMYAAGKVNAQDMRQLTEAMIPAWQLLADELGVSVAEAMKQVTAGTVSAGVGISAVIGGMEKEFAGMMAQQAKTALGTISTIADATLKHISAAVEPLFNAITVGLNELATFLTGGGGKFITPAIYAMGIAIGVGVIPKVWGMIASIGAASVTLGGLSAAEIAAARAAGVLSIATGGVKVALLPLIVSLTTLTMAWQENWGGIRTTLGPVLESIGGAIGKIIDLLATFGVSVDAIGLTVTVVAAAITGKFVVGLLASALGMIGITIGATSAATSTTFLARALTGLVMVIGGSLGVIGIWLAAIFLLITKFDEISQGVRVLQYNMGMQLLAQAESSGNRELAAAIRERLALLVEEMRVTDEAIKARAEAQKALDEASTMGKMPSTSEFETWLDDFTRRAEERAGGITAGAADVKPLLDTFAATMEGVLEAAKVGGGDAMAEMAKGILEKQNLPMDALSTLNTMLTREMTAQSEITRLVGALQSKRLAEGMASEDAAVKAQAIATTKIITERLDVLTNGAYSAGSNAMVNVGNGLRSNEAINAVITGLQTTLSPVAKALDEFMGDAGGGFSFSKALELVTGTLSRAANSSSVLTNEWETKYKPSAKDAANATKEVDDWLKRLLQDQEDAAAGTRDMADEQYALAEAWKVVEETAKKYFDTIHEANLKAIQDAHDLGDAQLDAQIAAARLPGKQMSASFQAMQDARKLAELQKAVADAAASGDQKALFEAQQALSDFQTEQEITRLTDIGEGQVTALEAQRKMNDDLLKQQQEAEDLRYQSQTDAFTKELEQLQSYLSRHPEAWRKVHKGVLALLDKFGIDYKNVGSTLGLEFAKGLDSAMDIVKKSAAALAAAAAAELAAKNAAKPDLNPPIVPVTPTPTPPNPSPPGVPLATGMWSVPTDNLLARLHSQEMVVPAGPARLLRDLLAGGGGGGGSAWQTVASAGVSRASAALGEGGPRSGSGTLVIQLDGNELTRVVDQRLAVHEDLVTVRPMGTSQW